MTTAEMLIAKGKAKGFAIGKAEGFAIGKAIGKAEGFAIGLAEAKAEGKAKEKETIVCNAYKKVRDIHFVADITAISPEQVLAILERNSLIE